MIKKCYPNLLFEFEIISGSVLREDVFMRNVAFQLILLTLVGFSSSFGDSPDINYESCTCIQDVLNYETRLILECDQDNVDHLVDLYISRGETYMINGQFSDAVDDFFIAYVFLEKVKNDALLRFRLLFNEIMWHAFMGDEKKVMIIGEYLVSSFDEICFQKRFGNQNVNLSTVRAPLFFCKTKIVGPDQEPYPGWCKEIVISTGVALAQLICVLPKNAAKIALGSVIAILEQKALDCCEAGGLWKGCVGPLAEKFNNWNQKWKVLKIPPDPAYD